jgi:hypothetical protein
VRPAPGPDAAPAELTALRERLEALSAQFNETGERLATEARTWKQAGLPPSENLIDALSECSQKFAALRDEALGLAGPRGISATAAEVEDLSQLGLLLEAIGEVQARRAQLEAVREQAIRVLDHVRALVSSDGKDYPPLASCQSKASELRRAIVDSPVTELPPEAAQLAEGEHSFNALLVLVEGTEGLSDEVWANTLDVVVRDYGKPLSVALARAKVVLPAGK